MRTFNWISFLIGSLVGIGISSVGYLMLNSTSLESEIVSKEKPMLTASLPSESSRVEEKTIKIEELKTNEKKLEKKPVEKLLDEDSLLLDSLGLVIDEYHLDSLSMDSTMGLQEELNIAREQMLSSELFELIKLDTISTPLSLADSLLSDDLNLNTKGDNNFITVEMWQSPLNYRGYKLNNNKLILYGFDMEQVLKLEKMTSQVRLTTTNQMYQLDYTEELLPLH